MPVTSKRGSFIAKPSRDARVNQPSNRTEFVNEQLRSQFDRIVFNFPHAESQDVERQQRLL